MGDRRIEILHHADGDDGVEIFRPPVVLGRRRDPRIAPAREFVAAHRGAVQRLMDWLAPRVAARADR
jgi:hypothetical protein